MKIVRRDVIDDSHLEPFIPDPVIRQILARRGIKTEQDVACKLCDIFHYKDFHDIEKPVPLSQTQSSIKNLS